MEQISPIQALLQQRTLLQLEYYTEKEAFRKLTEQMGLQRKVKRGDAWFPLQVGKSFYNSLNQTAIEVFRTSDQDIEHNFEFGRPVMFFMVKKMGKNENQGSTALQLSENPSDANHKVQSSNLKVQSIKYFSFTGTVSYVDGDRMVITVPDSAPLLDLQQSTEPIGVQLSFDETSYKLMFEALDRVMKAKNNRLAYLRDLFYSHQKADRFSFEPMKFPWLNPTQERAVNEVLWAKDVAIVHGPPGTGKTTTLVEAINETLMRESQVLVCAQSNMAVDWISERLVDRGINVLRIGNPTRVNDKMLGFTYERRFESHADYPQLWAIRKAIRELRKNRKKGSENYHQKMDRLKSRAAEIELRINAELFGEARVIACTLVGSAHHLLEGMKFGTLFIDEAAQALEAACWIPMKRASRVILAGDHCQLPPTVKSIAALRAGLGKTLMERIAENKPEVVTLLKIQYRMNDEIMRFSSDWFYGGKVESAPQIKYRSVLDYDHPITWIDTGEESEERRVKSEEFNSSSDDASEESEEQENSSLFTHHSSLYKEQFVGESFGRINKAEAELTLLTLAEYFTKIGKQRVLSESIDVGIISPYRAQVQYLKKFIKKYEFFKPYRRLISVNTVDGFQGQERDVILISLVRSNDEGQIGFLKDLRRMNVAMTRARMKLIILGNKDTMTRHPFYKKLWEYVEAINNNE
ncbi:AAA domain-containing protein [Prevotella copri]|uniref:AAA domain-containing protein n=1 Tax=Segatella copri TaxID=165179 RepID=A0AAW5IYI8_9BACT|nr:AAA domain-containing protein [Segatella copri]MCP9552988.1 AAA domain-containing protein [Segatella copri]MCP9573745.1 AAA domain-containing protein [Segatella copri]MCP9576791.1 AAA domain-containing protein [Segatella copri]MCP9579627.1 AAA domain-containing protein [Segatella copri]MCP9582559.1 AAA domain-containing protein [Segatella copri]